MSSYIILKMDRETKESMFLMRNATRTKTFKNDI